MAALTGLFIADSYKALLKTVDNDVLGAAAKEIVDGYGNVSGVLFDTSGNVTINGNFRALDAILDSSGSAGTAGQVLTTTGSTTQWQSLSSVSGVTGSGTAGYLPLWSTNSALTNSIAIQSGSTITISGTLTATTKINTPTLQLTGGTGAQGTLSWNADEETVDLIQNGATLQLGQEIQIHCKNQTGALIPDGTPVYAAGTLGASGRIKIAPMIANGSIQAKYFLGVTTEDIADGGDGKITTFGKIRGLNTSAYTEGQTLWVSSTVAGAFQTTRPIAPNLDLEVAIVINSHVNNGTIFVRATNGHYLGAAHDVNITSVAENDLLVYKTNRWVNTKSIGDLSAANVTLSGYLRGPATFVIDPAAYGDETGLVQILGDLRVDGTTTTINSTTISVSDKNITLAKDAATAGDANGAGITIAGANATLTYLSASDDFTFNKNVNASRFVGPLTGNVTGTVSTLSNHDTDDLNEGLTNLYFTTTRARDSFSAGTGVAINAGEISIGQSVGTTDNVTFGVVTASLSGNASTASALQTARNIALDGSVTGNADFDGSGNITITTTTNHNHDDRYYTETESDAKYLLNTTDTLDGDLNVTGEVQAQKWFVSDKNTTIAGAGPYDWVHLGAYSADASRAAAVQIGDVDGARYSIRGGGYDLTFGKHIASSDTWNNVMRFEATGVDGVPNVRILNDLNVDGDLSVTGTIDLSNADLNIGAADIIFDTISTGANRGLIWNVSPSGFLSKLVGGGADGGKVTLFANMDDAITTGNIFEIKDGSTGSLFLGLSHAGILTAGGGTSTQWNTAYGWGNHAGLYLTSNVNSEQTVGVRNAYWNSDGNRMYTDPRWNESGYDADLGCLHIYSTTSAGVTYGRAGLALYNDAAYQYLTTKNGQSGLYVNNYKIITAETIGSQSVNYAAGAGNASTLDTLDSSQFLRSDESDTMTGSLTVNGAGVGITATSSQNTGLIVDGGTNSGIISEFKFGTTKAVINTSGGGYFLGDVGIGRTSPQSKLHVVGGGNTFQFAMKLAKSSYDDVGGHTTLIGIGCENAAWSRSAIGHTRTTSYDAGYLGFYVSNNNGNSDELVASDLRMMINRDGNVGINTTSPYRKFQVDGGAGVRNGSFWLGDESGSTNDGIEFYKSSNILRIYKNSGSFGGTYSGEAVNLDLFSGYAYSTRISGGGDSYFAGGGNVGIGTNSPSQKLHIHDGDLAITSTYSSGVNDILFSGGSTSGSASNTTARIRNVSTAPSGQAYGDLLFSVNRGDAFVDALYIKGSGNVGIGTTNPEAALHLNADSAWFGNGGDFYFSARCGASGKYYHIQNNAIRTTIDSDGNLGINTTNPSQKLHVNGYIRYGTDSYYTNTGFDSNGFYQDTNGSTAQTQTIRLQSNFLSGVNNYNGIKIGALAIGNASEGVTIYTGGYDNNRLTITASGLVGIGTASPEASLDVVSNSGGNGIAIRTRPANDWGWLIYDSYDSSERLAEIGVNRVGVSSGDLYFTTSGSTKMVIKSNGNVGIGTTNPAHTFHVDMTKGSTNVFFQSGVNDPEIFYGNSLANADCGVFRWRSSGLSIHSYGQSYGSQLFIDADTDRIGIGTTSPSYKLDVAGTIATNSLYTFSSNWTAGTANKIRGYFGNDDKSIQFLYDNSPAGLLLKDNNSFLLSVNSGNTIYANSSGSVGIGTTSPGAKLDVAGNTRVSLSNAGSDWLSTWDNTATNGHKMYFGYGNAEGTRYGLYIEGGTTSNHDLAVANKFYVYGNGNVGVGSSTTAINKFAVIKSNTYGYYNRTEPLAVFQGVLPTLLVAHDGNATNEYAEIKLGNNQITYYPYSAYIRGVQYSGIDRYKLEFGTSNGAPSATRMTILANGAVGIGTTSPTHQLHIATDDDNTYALRVQGATNNVSGVWTGIGIAGESANTKAAIIFQDIGDSYSRGKLHFAINDEQNQNSATPANARLTISNNGNVGIDDTTPDYKLDVNGTIRATGDVYAYSDVRVKENIETIDNALDKVMSMRGVSYNRTDDDDKTKKVGVIAQEIREVLPEVVSEQEDGMLSVSYGNIVGVLIEAIKEQQKQIDELKSLLDGSTK